MSKNSKCWHNRLMSKRLCEFSGCGRPHESRGLCAGHRYQRDRGQELRPLTVKRDVALRDTEGRKYCQAGDHWVPVTEFWSRAGSKDGLQVRCKMCSIGRYYGLSAVQYQAMLDKQEGRCAVCGKSDKLFVDHDHACCPGRNSCGRCVRALLCRGCNTALGHTGDDPEKLRSLALYLEAHRADA